MFAESHWDRQVGCWQRSALWVQVHGFCDSAFDDSNRDNALSVQVTVHNGWWRPDVFTIRSPCIVVLAKSNYAPAQLNRSSNASDLSKLSRRASGWIPNSHKTNPMRLTSKTINGSLRCRGNCIWNSHLRWCYCAVPMLHIRTEQCRDTSLPERKQSNKSHCGRISRSRSFSAATRWRGAVRVHCRVPAAASKLHNSGDLLCHSDPQRVIQFISAAGVRWQHAAGSVIRRRPLHCMFTSIALL